MRLAKSIALFMSIVLFPSCNGAMVVTYPDALQVGSQQYRITSDGEISIDIHFNQPYDPETIVVGKTLILVTEKDLNAAGNWIPLSAEGEVIRFTTTMTIGDLLIHDPDGFFTLKLIGSDAGDGAIKSKSGRHLDGNRDGTDGGDYETTFSHVG